jgi:hypothetical protein
VAYIRIQEINNKVDITVTLWNDERLSVAWRVSNIKAIVA